MAEQQWACRACTFQNHPTISECEMCGTERGRKSAGRGSGHGHGHERDGRVRGKRRGSRGERGPESGQKQLQQQPAMTTATDRTRLKRNVSAANSTSTKASKSPTGADQSRDLQQKRLAALAALGGSTTLPCNDEPNRASSNQAKLKGRDSGKQSANSRPAKSRGRGSGNDSSIRSKAKGEGRQQKNEKKAADQQSHRTKRTDKPPGVKDQRAQSVGNKGKKKTVSPKAVDSTQQGQWGGRNPANEWPTAPPLHTDGLVTVLHVAEKPSIAQALANALCGKSSKRPEQRHGPTPVHEFTSVPFHVPELGSSVRCKHRVTSGAFLTTSAV